MRPLKLTDRDLYVPIAFWGEVIQLVAPKPAGMHPAFGRALMTFQQYSQTIQGDLGETVRNCHKVLTTFLDGAEATVREESGEHEGRLGRPRDLPFGEEELSYQVFQYHGQDVSSLNGASVGKVLIQYERFLSVLHFMEAKVGEGGLGALQGSFNNMLFLLDQACEAMENAITRAPVRRSAVLGDVPDHDFIFPQGKEPSNEYPDGTICKILQQGYVWEDKELVEAVVMVSGEE